MNFAKIAAIAVLMGVPGNFAVAYQLESQTPQLEESTSSQTIEQKLPLDWPCESCFLVDQESTVNESGEQVTESSTRAAGSIVTDEKMKARNSFQPLNPFFARYLPWYFSNEEKTDQFRTQRSRRATESAIAGSRAQQSILPTDAVLPLDATTPSLNAPTTSLGNQLTTTRSEQLPQLDELQLTELPAVKRGQTITLRNNPAELSRRELTPATSAQELSPQAAPRPQAISGQAMSTQSLELTGQQLTLSPQQLSATQTEKLLGDTELATEQWQPVTPRNLEVPGIEPHATALNPVTVPQTEGVLPRRSLESQPMVQTLRPATMDGQTIEHQQSIEHATTTVEPGLAFRQPLTTEKIERDYNAGSSEKETLALPSALVTGESRRFTDAAPSESTIASTNVALPNRKSAAVTSAITSSGFYRKAAGWWALLPWLLMTMLGWVAWRQCGKRRAFASNAEATDSTVRTSRATKTTVATAEQPSGNRSSASRDSLTGSGSKTQLESDGSRRSTQDSIEEQSRSVSAEFRETTGESVVTENASQNGVDYFDEIDECDFLESNELKAEGHTSSLQASSRRSNALDSREISNAESERAESERSELERPESLRAESGRTESERTVSERSESERTESQRTESQRTELQRSESWRTESGRTESERPESRRTASERSGLGRAESQRTESLESTYNKVDLHDERTEEREFTNSTNTDVRSTEQSEFDFEAGDTRAVEENEVEVQDDRTGMRYDNETSQASDGTVRYFDRDDRNNEVDNQFATEDVTNRTRFDHDDASSARTGDAGSSTGQEDDFRSAKRRDSRSDGSDDLTRIKGIGSATAKRLYAANIRTYEDLYNCDFERLRRIASTNRSNFDADQLRLWTLQAKYAMSGNWARVKQVQIKNGLESKSVSQRTDSELRNRTQTESANDSSAKPDDLTLIRGIGPAIQRVLHDNGVTQFRQLSDRGPEGLKELFRGQESRFQMINPASWIAQAEHICKRRLEGDLDSEENLLQEIRDISKLAASALKSDATETTSAVSTKK